MGEASGSQTQLGSTQSTTPQRELNMFEKLLERYDITETAAEQRQLDYNLRHQRLSRLTNTQHQP